MGSKYDNSFPRLILFTVHILKKDMSVYISGPFISVVRGKMSGGPQTGKWIKSLQKHISITWILMFICNEGCTVFSQHGKIVHGQQKVENH